MKRRLLIAGPLAAVASLVLPGVAFGATPILETPEASINAMWVIVAGVLVMFMQAGFLLLEVGFSRAKNAGAGVAKVLVNFSIASLCYWAVGFALAFGGLGEIAGTHGFFLDVGSTVEQAGKSIPFVETYSISPAAFMFFQFVFCAVSLAIVWGATLERIKFGAYVIYAIVFSSVLYPVLSHWIFGGGWLQVNVGMQDFAGSTVVHLIGATGALAALLLLGPRVGKYGRDGKPRAIPGHSMPLVGLGVLILWLGWFGFNPGSTLAASDLVAHIAMTTNLAAASGAMLAMITIWIIGRKPDVGMTANGALAGLVAITAGCAFVEPWAAAVIGAAGGIVVVLGVLGLERARVDDPVGAIAVHGIAGALGTLAVGIFAAPRLVEGLVDNPGLAYGGGVSLLGTQALGVLAVFGWAFGGSYLMFRAIKATVGLRVSADEEMEGLDIGEHGMWGYPEAFLGPTGLATPEAVEEARAGMRTGLAAKAVIEPSS